MSASEHQNGEPVFGEQKSSVKIATTAKGDATVEIKVYDGTDGAALEQIRTMAVHAYQQTLAAVRS